MPNYLIKMSIPIDGEDEADVLMKFRDWLANQDEPFRPYVTLVPDTDVADRLLGGAEKEPIAEDIDMEAFEWLHRQTKEFMEPNITWFDEGELEAPEDSLPVEPLGAGWYSRLSAPGYMDCTEWSGPFETELEAVLDLHELYGD